MPARRYHPRVLQGIVVAIGLTAMLYGWYRSLIFEEYAIIQFGERASPRSESPPEIRGNFAFDVTLPTEGMLSLPWRSLVLVALTLLSFVGRQKNFAAESSPPPP